MLIRIDSCGECGWFKPGEDYMSVVSLSGCEWERTAATCRHPNGPKNLYDYLPQIHPDCPLRKREVKTMNPEPHCNCPDTCFWHTRAKDDTQPCGTCGGSGTRDTCLVCHGKGASLVHGVPCQSCHGKGVPCQGCATHDYGDYLGKHGHPCPDCRKKTTSANENTT